MVAQSNKHLSSRAAPPLPVNVVETMQAMTQAITADLLVPAEDAASEALQNQPTPTPCPRCDGDGSIARGVPCLVCGGLGELLNRAEVAHRLLSMPNGDPPHCAPYILALVPLASTDNPRWLANLIERTATAQDLDVEQLLAIFGELIFWAETFEHQAPYWRLAGRQIMRLISAQLMAALPESEALA